MDSAKSAAGEVRSLLGYLLRNRGLLLRGCALLMLGALLQLVFPVGAQILVDGTLKLGDPRWHDIDTVCLGLGGIVLCIAVCRYFESCWFQELGEQAISTLRSEAFSRLVRLPMRWFSDKRAADIGNRLLADLSQVQDLWIFDLRMLLTYGAVLLGCGIMLFVTCWQLAASVLLAVPPVVLIAVLLGGKIRRSGTLAQERLAAGSVIVQESLQALPSVKSFVGEQRESRRFSQSMTEYVVEALRGGKLRSLLVSLILAVLLSAWVYVMWRGSVMIREGYLTPGRFTAFMFYLGFAGTSAGFVAENFAKVQRALGAHGRVYEILTAVPEPDEMAEKSSDLLPISGAIQFEDVKFSYGSPDAPAVLQGVTFSTAAGKSVAIVGGSGAGKSTLAALLCRFYEPVSGRILFDGRDAAELPLSWVRSQIAYVPQEVLLFGGSIRDNIAFGKPGSTEEEIREAARMAHALEFIESQPDKFETTVGDRGAQLSGGQRQRIALARALLKNPKILVLDEATSALDPESEAHIQAALAELSHTRTLFIIAHRLSTVRQADQILVLKGGIVVESGTHSELHAAHGTYWHLCEQ